MTTALHSPPIMTRQVLTREAPTGPYPLRRCGNDASTLPQLHHLAQPSVISPLSLPAPVRAPCGAPLVSNFDSVWQQDSIPIATATAMATFSVPTATPNSQNHRPSSASCSSSTLLVATEPARPSRSCAPAGARYRSASANPASRIRSLGSLRLVPTHAGGPTPPVASPPPSISNRSTSSTERAKYLEMEAERVSWEAQKAGYLRHIEVLEAKLKEAIMEKEELQDQLDATITDAETAFRDDIVAHIANHKSITADSSSAKTKGWAPLQPSTFVPRDSIPGAKVSSIDAAVVEAHVDKVTSPGGTQTAAATVSTTIIHSEKQNQPVRELDTTKTLDVSKINPRLEGIRLKAAAIQRPTFAISQVSPPLFCNQGDKNTSSVLEPESSAQASSSRKQDAELFVPKSSMAQTLHALATAESSRRRMHAGHTPSHSVAHFPLPVAEEVTEASLTAVGKDDERHHKKVQDEDVHYEPADDKPLKGHLMAQSDGGPDVFLDEFTKKLENISSGAEDGVPAVLRNQKQPPNEDILALEVDVVGGTDDPGEGGVNVEVDAEADIPLKLKTSTNFGLPWGQLRRSNRKLEAING